MAHDLLHALFALGVLVIPLVVAWGLVARKLRRRERDGHASPKPGDRS